MDLDKFKKVFEALNIECYVEDENILSVPKYFVALHFRKRFLFWHGVVLVSRYVFKDDRFSGIPQSNLIDFHNDYRRFLYSSLDLYKPLMPHVADYGIVTSGHRVNSFFIYTKELLVTKDTKNFFSSFIGLYIAFSHQRDVFAGALLNYFDIPPHINNLGHLTSQDLDLIYNEGFFEAHTSPFNY